MYLHTLCCWLPSTESSHRFVTLSSLRVSVCACICIYCVGDRPPQNHHTGLWYCLYFVSVSVCAWSCIHCVGDHPPHSPHTGLWHCLHFVCVCVCSWIHCVSDHPPHCPHTGLWHCLHFVCVCVAVSIVLVTTLHTVLTHVCDTVFTLCVCVCVCVCSWIHCVSDHPPHSPHTGLWPCLHFVCVCVAVYVVLVTALHSIITQVCKTVSTSCMPVGIKSNQNVYL